MAPTQNPADSPSWLRRVLCLLYESLLLLALLMFVALIYLTLVGDSTTSPKRYFFQLYLWLVSAGYFTWSWVHGGQTLAMQTWHIRLVSRGSQPLSARRALLRYVVATLLFGVSFIWAWFDREGLSLHDRLAGTRLVLVPGKTRNRA